MWKRRRLAKKYAKLARTIDSLSDGQAILQDNDCDDVRTISVAIKPNGGPYKGGTFMFDITLFDGDAPPRVSCKTEILHPNIRYEEQGQAVCLNIFDEWEAHFGWDDIIQGLLFLFHEPNWDDPLNEYFFIIMNNKKELSYAEIIQKTLLGLDVAGQDWPFNYEGDDLEELKAKYTGSVINTSEIPPAPPLPQNLLSSNANNIPSSPPQQQNITSNSANDIPPSPMQQQKITSDSVNNIPPAPPLPQNISSNNVDNMQSDSSLSQSITFNNVNNIPPAQPLPQNITSDSVNRISSVSLDPPQQIILHNAVPGPSLTNCLRHGESPIKQLNDEIPVLPVHDRGVTVGAATQMCDCSHCAAVQCSDDTHTDTIGHRQKPKHRTMRSRFVKYLGNILKIKRRTSSHKR